MVLRVLLSAALCGWALLCADIWVSTEECSLAFLASYFASREFSQMLFIWKCLYFAPVLKVLLDVRFLVIFLPPS